MTEEFKRVMPTGPAVPKFVPSGEPTVRMEEAKRLRAERFEAKLALRTWLDAFEKGLPEALERRIAEDKAGAPIMCVLDDVIARLTAKLGPIEMPSPDPRGKMTSTVLQRLRLSRRCVLRQDDAGEWWVAPA